MLVCQCVRGDDGLSWITTCGFYFCVTVWVIGTSQCDSLLKSGNIFPFTSICSYLVALHFSLSPCQFFRIYLNAMPKFTSGSLIYVCQVCVCSLCQKPKGQERSDSLWEKKKSVFSSASALGQRRLRASTNVPYRPLSWRTFCLRTSANRYKTTFFSPFCFFTKTFRSHLVFLPCLMCGRDRWAGVGVDGKQVQQVTNRRRS